MAEIAGKRGALGARSKEEIVRGVWSSGGGAVAFGRVCRPESASLRSPAEACILCLFDRGDAELAESSASALTLSGVVLTAGMISPSLLNFLISSRLPYLIVKEGFSHKVMGRVALIDAQRDVLIVDPDIDTLNCYAEDNRISRSALPERSALWQDSSYGLTVKKERSGKSVLVRGIESVSHTELFDALADIAEEFCGLPITIGIDLSAAGDGFDERIEAIFRSAVYGNFSLMLENYRSESDIFLARDRLSGVFCALESEGREFNGYLRKGLLLSAPIWLMQNIAHGKADFICFDFDRLTAALLGLELCELQSAEFPKRELFRAWESYLLSFAPSCELCAEAESLGNSPIFREWCAIAGIDKVFGRL